MFSTGGYEEFPRSSLGNMNILETNEDIDKSIDKQLVSPSDPNVDFQGKKIMSQEI